MAFGNLRRRAAPWIPWGDAAPPDRSRLAAPVTLSYLAIAWLLFLPGARRAPGPVWGPYYVADPARVDRFSLHFPDLIEAPWSLLMALGTGPIMHRTSGQLLFVTGALLWVAVPFERREGPLRTGILFLLGSLVGALAALVVLGGLLAAGATWEPILDSWEAPWRGGSAAAFAVAGAALARAPRPLPGILLVAAWEFLVAVPFMRPAIPLFHASAFVLGFVLCRWGPWKGLCRGS